MVNSSIFYKMFTMGVNYIMSFSFSQKEIGKRIRDQRLKNKLTIEKLCELLDVSPSFIGLVERGTSGISIEKLCRLSEIFLCVH